MTQIDLTIKEAAALFGCSYQTVQAWIKAGRIKAYRLGETGSYRIPRAEVERVRAEWAYKPDITPHFKGIACDLRHLDAPRINRSPGALAG